MKKPCETCGNSFNALGNQKNCEICRRNIKLKRINKRGQEKLLNLADAESVVYRQHGRNITEMNPVDEFICSECGRCFLDSLNAYDEENEVCYEYEPNYCPHCGVKIDKE